MRRWLSLVLEAESLCKSPQATAYEGPYQWNTNQSHISGQWGKKYESEAILVVEEIGKS